MKPLMPQKSLPARRGLTFIELMFSVMILGVGMIIIAAAFPVAISEQRATVDEGTVGSIERGAIRTLQAAVQIQAPATAWLPNTNYNTATFTGDVVSFGDTTKNDAAGKPLWNHIAGDLINPANSRYAWTALYMRPLNGTDNSKVTFFIVTMASRDSAEFDTTNLATTADTLRPTPITITYYYKGDTLSNAGLTSGVDDDDDDGKLDQDVIKVEGVPSGDKSLRAAVEGAFIVRGTNVKTTSVLFPQNAIIKLGTKYTTSELTSSAQTDGALRFRVSPGFNLNAADTGAINTAAAFVVGRYVSPSEPADENVQDQKQAPNKANRALSCRAITVNVNYPG